MPARGNIEYTQIALDSRNGTGAWIQMYGGGTVPSAGNMAVFDANLNVVDGGPPGSGGGGGNLVTSVFGRTGAVVGAIGDYSASQVTNAVDATQSYVNPTWIVSLPWSKITGAPITGVGSFNGRTGAVMPMTGDYTVSMIPGAVADPTTTIGDLLVRGISSIARLGVGSNGQVLTADSTQPLGVHWATPTGGGSGSQTPWLSDIQGANYSLWNTNAIEVDGGLLGNAYNSGGWRYRGPNSAFMLQVTGGQGTLFNTAPAGAPGALISFVNALTFADSGNVGVGTVSPNYKLDVAGPVNSNACYFVNGVSFACSDGANGINLTNVTNINGLPPGTGTGGSGGQIEETPVGRMDGTNTSFTLSHAPGPNALSLFLDGVLQQQGVDYTLSGNTITYTVAPNSADWHVAVYGLGGEAFPVMSVFGRTGNVVGASGDYIAAQVTDAVDQGARYANPAWITSLDWSKITNAPGPGTYQTPWLSNIDAAQYALNNPSSVTFSFQSPNRSGLINCTASGFNVSAGAGTVLALSGVNGLTLTSSIAMTFTANSPGGNAYQFSTSQVTGAIVMPINGNLGLSVASPQYRLDLAGDVNITGQYRVNGTPIGAGGSQTPWLQNIDGGGFSLSNASGITVNYNGPNAIQIAGNSSNSVGLLINNTFSGSHSFTLYSGGSTPGFGIYDNTIGGSTPAFFVGPTGNCGIGTTSPQVALGVNGSIRIIGPSPAPTSGQGTELQFASGSGWIYPYDRTAGAFLPLRIDGNALYLNSQNNAEIYCYGNVNFQGRDLRYAWTSEVDNWIGLNIYEGWSNRSNNCGMLLYTDPNSVQFYGSAANQGGVSGVGLNALFFFPNGGGPMEMYQDINMQGHAITNALISGGNVIAIPSYYAPMTGGSIILNGSWQNMPGCVFTVNQTGRFLVMLNAEIQSNALGPVVTGLLINNGGPYGQQTFHYVSGTCQCSQQFVVSASSGNQFTLAAYMNVGGGASASVYPACTNITAIYLGP